MTRWAVVVLILVIGGLPVWAQTGPPSDRRPPGASAGVRVTVQGRVLPGPGESRLPDFMTVTLSEFSGGLLQTRLVRSGLFQFRGVAPGRYVVRLECQGFRPVETVLDLQDVRNSRNEFLQITMGPRTQPATSGPPPDSATIDAGLLAVPRQAQRELERAQSSSRRQRYQTAVRHLKKAIKLHPQFPEAYNNLAVQYLRLNQPAKALQALQHSLEIRPTAEAYQNLGILHMEQGRLQEASIALFEAHRRDPEDGRTLRSLGELFFRAGQYQAALDWFDRISDEAEDPLLSLAKGHCYLRLKNYADSARYFEQFLELSPKSAQAKATRRLLSQIRQHLSAAQPQNR